MKFVSPSVWLVARTEELQRTKKKILENGRKMALKGLKIKISKNKKLCFFLMSQGVLCQKIRFLGQKPWPVAGEHTDTDTQTHRHTDRGFNPWVPYQGFSISSFCLWYERSNSNNNNINEEDYPKSNNSAQSHLTELVVQKWKKLLTSFNSLFPCYLLVTGR